MKKRLLTLLLSASTAFACGPYFPPSYLNGHPDDPTGDFSERINVPLELLYLAQEYSLIDDHVFPDSEAGSLEADIADFTEAATALAWTSRIEPYAKYAQNIRGGATNAVPPNVPEALQEFILYTEGYREMQADPDLVEPESWIRLLKLDPAQRHYRTTWANYMLGNLASSHGQPARGADFYADCRQAERDGFADALGLAHATYKRGYLSQTNRVDRIRSGVRAVAYYRMATDQKRMQHCLDHLQKELNDAANEAKLPLEDPLCLEAAALFQFGNTDLIARMDQAPPLKITPRLAWFMYRSGRINEGEAYLNHCPPDDALANWLRFRTAQRNGRNADAIGHLRKWMQALQTSDRMIFSTWYRFSVSTASILEGNLGKLLVTEGDMVSALDCFTKAGSYPDAALIAERYMSSDVLKSYVDTFDQRPSDASYEPIYFYGKTDQSEEYVEYKLSNLLARRLFREGRTEEAQAYYAPQWAQLLATYLDALKRAENPRLSRDERAAHLFHAARIMRWKGMELSGTAMAPDYTIVDGNFQHGGIVREAEVAGSAGAKTYASHAPEPDVRFHYRPIAVELAARAADLSKNRHQRATILWSAGAWIMGRHPQEADVYYKQLARIRFQALGKAADEQRWFPPATPELEAAFRSVEYVSPKTLASVAKEYGR